MGKYYPSSTPTLIFALPFPTIYLAKNERGFSKRNHTHLKIVHGESEVEGAPRCRQSFKLGIFGP